MTPNKTYVVQIVASFDVTAPDKQEALEVARRALLGIVLRPAEQQTEA